MDKAHANIRLRLQQHGFSFISDIYTKADLRNFIDVLGKK